MISSIKESYTYQENVILFGGVKEDFPEKETHVDGKD